jgi:hypothetical protein
MAATQGGDAPAPPLSDRLVWARTGNTTYWPALVCVSCLIHPPQAKAHSHTHTHTHAHKGTVSLCLSPC